MNSSQNISAYILCGGKSSRMQTEKGLVCFNEKPFIQYIINAIKPIANNIVLVTNNEDYKIFGCNLIEDIYTNKGPVGGIYTALEHSKVENNLILSCDIPFITTEVLKILIDNHLSSENNITFLSDGIKNYPLIGVYKKLLVNLFEEAILNEKLKLQRVIQTITNIVISIDIKYHSTLKNINTKQDLETSLQNMIEKNKPKLTLVGAGPGDPDLITIKAVKALNHANVVLYDALANEEILKHATQAEKIFVGKRKGSHTYTQGQINELIVSNALNYGHVVRLKGGDPFVFGRGSEEIEYTESFDIETEVIPGITSAIAVPGSKGIAVTQRNVAESFWVITGTTSDHKISSDIELAARSTATVVILMGMSKLNEITTVFRKNGKADTPIAIIQNGTRQGSKHGFGTISTIEKVVKEEKLSSPAIIVIGEVVKHSNKLLEYFEEDFFEDEFLFQNLDIMPYTKKE